MGNAQPFVSCAGGQPPDQKPSNIPQHEFLTQNQKLGAKSTWEFLCHTSTPTERGMRVFLRIFEIAPVTKTLFPFKDMPNEDLHRNSLFKGHATRFMKSVEFTMQNLDALDVIVNPTLVSIGNKHVHIKGFHPDYLDTFQTALIDIWDEDLGKKFSKETKEAWIKIFALITRKVFEGFQEETTRFRPPLPYEGKQNGVQSPEISANNNSCVSPDEMECELVNGDSNVVTLDA
ncbi:hypothetical protein CAPTEDRAFT_198978 [Capitella teleta]|uniref:Globin domain-containing protein n=1 Tax=Capitella teleta TaxID=283909 RepID=R7TFR3_CAPTE|nr:hypothetical protein CAPTEDRAFT_198978 [Capitella teleta]|eukprot:ELT92307.1 hypothetical protein CAPTEDRAFT_198978 [Capitella teleta]